VVRRLPALHHLHEAAHAWAAKLGGDLTASTAARSRSTRLPHIRREPFGMVVFPDHHLHCQPLDDGLGQRALRSFLGATHPRRAAWMSLAGPCANFTLAILAGILIHVGIWTGVLRYPESASFMAGRGARIGRCRAWHRHVPQPVFSLNLLLGCFNLLPIPPLDGFGVVGLFLSDDAGRRFQQFRLVAAQLHLHRTLVAWQVFGPVFQSIFYFPAGALSGLTCGCIPTGCRYPPAARASTNSRLRSPPGSPKQGHRVGS